MSAVISALPNMIDTYENIVFSPNYLVDVQALIMVRDESTGGWIPMGRGGLSKVSVRKCAVPDGSGQMKIAYLIFGQRIPDDSVILSCFIKKDFEYNKVMPTFYHWKTKENRFGLTFQTTADARAFDKGFRTAIKEIVGGTGEKSHRSRKKRASEIDDDETLELPVSGVDSRSTSDSSLRCSPQTTPQEQAAQMSHFFNIRSESESPSESEKYDYFQLSTGQGYTYPDAEGTKLVLQESSGSVKIKGAEAVPQNAANPSTKDKKKGGRHRCRYCQEIYVEGDNKRGACEYAPDCVRTTIDEVACVRAARCMMYHCMSDEEGEFAQHPCECTCEDDSGIRWMALAFLSIFVPCLCLYPPLRSCHWCCVRVGLCGGRHRSAS